MTKVLYSVRAMPSLNDIIYSLTCLVFIFSGRVVMAPTIFQSPDESPPNLLSMPSDLRIFDVPVLLR